MTKVSEGGGLVRPSVMGVGVGVKRTFLFATAGLTRPERVSPHSREVWGGHPHGAHFSQLTGGGFGTSRSKYKTLVLLCEPQQNVHHQQSLMHTSSIIKLLY